MEWLIFIVFAEIVVLSERGRGMLNTTVNLQQLTKDNMIFTSLNAIENQLCMRGMLPLCQLAKRQHDSNNSFNAYHKIDSM